MQNFFHISSRYRNEIKIYTATTGVDLQGFKTWQKPKGASFVFMVTIAGGGGGGGGFTRAAGNPGGGGGGGACSGITRFMCPAIVLPDTLYIQAGAGGGGGAASTNGANGLNSYILTTPSVAAEPNIICHSGINVPGGGTAGTSGAAGAAGTVPTIATIQAPNMFGHWFSTVGIVGLAGGAQTGANGAALNSWQVMPLTPGGGGAGCTTSDFNGGSVSNPALLDVGNQGYYPNAVIVQGGASGAINGGSGINKITPFFCTGGSGGRSNNTGQAGSGGCGGYGCGGGGGAAGATGGMGGNGGSGLIVIVTI